MKMKLTLLPLAIAAALASGSHAATIVWGTATNISGDLDVSTTGTFVYAEHWGGTNSTINGVAFSAAQNNVFASGTVGVNANINTTPNTVSTAYRDMLKGNWYQAGGETVTLKNLTIAQEYLVQIWSSDTRYATNQDLQITGGPSLDINNGATNVGLGDYAIGTFTANAVTQSIAFTAINNGTIVNAIQVRAIPEPGAALLGGLGMLALLRRRR